MLESQLNNDQTLLISKRDSNSRYFFTNYVKNNNNVITYDLFNYNSSFAEDLQYHIVQSMEKNRLDKIAVKYYNDSKLWWLIALANEIIDPFIITVGTTLKIPHANSFLINGID